jgi:hypothetical protein
LLGFNSFLILLSEIKSFARMYLTPYSLIEITIRYLAISINIKHIIYFLELLLRHLKTPVIKVKFEFMLLYCLLSVIYIFTHIFKCFWNSFPLLSYFFNNNWFQLICWFILNC